MALRLDDLGRPEAGLWAVREAVDQEAAFRSTGGTPPPSGIGGPRWSRRTQMIAGTELDR